MGHTAVNLGAVVSGRTLLGIGAGSATYVLAAIQLNTEVCQSAAVGVDFAGCARRGGVERAKARAPVQFVAVAVITLLVVVEDAVATGYVDDVTGGVAPSDIGRSVIYVGRQLPLGAARDQNKGGRGQEKTSQRQSELRYWQTRASAACFNVHRALQGRGAYSPYGVT